MLQIFNNFVRFPFLKFRMPIYGNSYRPIKHIFIFASLPFIAVLCSDYFAKAKSKPRDLVNRVHCWLFTDCYWLLSDLVLCMGLTQPSTPKYSIMHCILCVCVYLQISFNTNFPNIDSIHQWFVVIRYALRLQ